MIVKDEERTLERCFTSVRGRVAEMVVVDTGSRDRTVDIAQAAGARVVSFPWVNDFSAARNAGLEAATQPWILVLDADETLEPGPLEPPAADGGEVVIRNLAPPQDPVAWHDFPLVRLFRRDPRFRYQGAIHEQIRASIELAGGKIQRTSLRIVHTGYADPVLANGQRRAERNASLIRAQLALNLEDAYLWYQLGITEKALGNAPAAEMALTKAQRVRQGPVIDADLAMRRAQLALERDDFDRCVEQASRTLALDPDQPVALQCRAVAHLQLGRVAEAVPDLRRVLGLGVLREPVQADFQRLLVLLGAG